MKQIFLPFLCLFFSTSIFSQAKTTPKSSLLWEVSGKGLKAKSYLYGTFHIQCKDEWSITPVLKQKLTACSLLIGEMDEKQLENPMKMMMALKTDTSLDKLMDSTTYEKFSTDFQNITNMPLMLFKGFKPFLASSMLTMKLIQCAESIQPEKEFFTIANNKKIKIIGFENIEDQVGAFNSVPLDSQINSLLLMTKNFDSSKNEMKKLMEVYKKRNLDSIYNFMQAGGMGQEFEANLLNKRNANWMPTIFKQIQKQPTFIAVGAAHLCGKNGLIELLKKQGYTLKPVAY